MKTRTALANTALIFALSCVTDGVLAQTPSATCKDSLREYSISEGGTAVTRITVTRNVINLHDKDNKVIARLNCSPKMAPEFKKPVKHDLNLGIFLIGPLAEIAAGGRLYHLESEVPVRTAMRIGTDASEPSLTVTSAVDSSKPAIVVSCASKPLVKVGDHLYGAPLKEPNCYEKVDFTLQKRVTKEYSATPLSEAQSAELKKGGKK